MLKNRPGVVYRKLDVPTPELELVAAWKIEKVSPVLEKFLQVVREVAKNQKSN